MHIKQAGGISSLGHLRPEGEITLKDTEEQLYRKGGLLLFS